MKNQENNKRKNKKETEIFWLLTRNEKLAKEKGGVRLKKGVEGDRIKKKEGYR